ncbi:Ribosomal protein S18 acetylase RimI [Pseudarcicella hirudinis]|uniref:Ribosomal protein S18 acetylase RimI n=1 Tax=Pseudarcicella hirudinis TaxID=1079859 RepID=A0A1I5N372_9BACT|nr:GNAT family N-acetyltransferase [Pseudarcicella hirudinis]SFP15731.1 Ribosomal protein S18 acetylase RimI [Pseudarcicella hirudinis]
MSDTIKIYEANISQVGLIQEIARETWGPTYGSILSPEQIEYMMEMMYSTDVLEKQFENHTFLFLENEGKVVGFAGFEPKSEQLIKLHKIYFLPETQGKGFGKLMVEEICKRVETSGFSILELNVNRFNKARFFYEKLSFQVVDEVDVNIGNGFLMNDYVMQRKI